MSTGIIFTYFYHTQHYRDMPLWINKIWEPLGIIKIANLDTSWSTFFPDLCSWRFWTNTPAGKNAWLDPRRHHEGTTLINISIFTLTTYNVHHHYFLYPLSAFSTHSPHTTCTISTKLGFILIKTLITLPLTLFLLPVSRVCELCEPWSTSRPPQKQRWKVFAQVTHRTQSCPNSSSKFYKTPHLPASFPPPSPWCRSRPGSDGRLADWADSEAVGGDSWAGAACGWFWASLRVSVFWLPWLSASQKPPGKAAPAAELTFMLTWTCTSPENTGTTRHCKYPGGNNSNNNTHTHTQSRIE